MLRNVLKKTVPEEICQKGQEENYRKTRKFWIFFDFWERNDLLLQNPLNLGRQSKNWLQLVNFSFWKHWATVIYLEPYRLQFAWNQRTYFSRCNERCINLQIYLLYRVIYRRIGKTMIPSMLHSSSLLATITVGGFNGIAAAFGVLGLVQISQFIYYGLDNNDPSKD